MVAGVGVGVILSHLCYRSENVELISHLCLSRNWRWGGKVGWEVGREGGEGRWGGRWGGKVGWEVGREVEGGVGVGWEVGREVRKVGREVGREVGGGEGSERGVV